MYTLVPTVPRTGLGIIPLVIMGIVAAASAAGQSVYQGYQAGKSRRFAAQMQARQEEQAEKERKSREKLLIAGGVGLVFIVLTMRRR